MDVIRLGERSHHDDFLLFFLGHLLGGVSVEINLANRRAGRGIHTLSKILAGTLRLVHGLLIELGVQQRIHLLRGDA